MTTIDPGSPVHRDEQRSSTSSTPTEIKESGRKSSSTASPSFSYSSRPSLPSSSESTTTSVSTTALAQIHQPKKAPQTKWVKRVKPDDQDRIPKRVKFEVLDTLEDSFQTPDKIEVAKERAQLINTVDLVVKQFNSKISYLERLGDPSLDERISALKLERELYQKRKDQGELWASTNAPRFAFQTLGAERARREYIPVLGDLWMHSVHDAQNKTVSTVSRSAAVTDFTHGRVSLQELQDYPLLRRLALGKEVSRDKTKELVSLYLGSLPKTIPLQGKMLVAIQKLVAQIESSVIKDYDIDINPAKGSLRTPELEKIIEDRVNRLTDQVLQDLSIHFQTNPVKTQEVIYGRIGLIDPKKKADVNRDGFVNYERTQALDMAAIYRELNGRSIVFDIRDASMGPYIDRENRIHMPRSFYQGAHPLEPVTLNAIYVNISAQGNTKNEGLQKGINARALNTMGALVAKNLIPSNEYTKLKEKLKHSHRDPFETAHHAMKLFSKLGYASADCFGGKDRTGYALALITNDLLEEVAENLSADKPNNERYKHNLLVKWGHQLVGPNGLIARIIKHSSGYQTPKLRDYGLKLYRTETLKGKIKRIGDYFEGARIALGPKVLPELVGKGQLYAYWTEPQITSRSQSED